jgi:hypothetical protein
MWVCNTSQPLADLDLDELLQVGQDMFSTTNTSLQCGAVDTAIATLQEAIPPLAHTRSRSSGGQRTFSTDMSSPYPCPPRLAPASNYPKANPEHVPLLALSLISHHPSPHPFQEANGRASPKLNLQWQALPH